jgi:O-antigen/teichoic acid export membrane protein
MTRNQAVRRRLLEHIRPIDPMNRSALALAANTGITSALGFVYWIVAAHYYNPATVGESAALISALTLLSTFTALNLGNTLVRFLPAAGAHAARYTLRAYLAVMAVSLVGGVAALPLLDQLTLVQHVLEFGGFGVAVILLAVVAWPLFGIQDAVAIGARSPVWVPTENAVFGIGKLVLLAVFAELGRLGIIASWLATMLIVLPLMAFLIFHQLLPRHAADSVATGSEAVTRRALAGFLTVDNLSLITTSAIYHLLPVIVATRAGSEANGYFFVAWAVGSALDLALVNVGSSLVVESSRQRDRLGLLARALLRRTAALLIPIVAVVLVAAPLILDMYGDRYAEQSSMLMRLVVLAALPRMIMVVWVSANRVRQCLGRILAVQAGIFVTVVGLCWHLVPLYGITVVGIVYVIVQAVAVLVVLPDLVNIFRTVPSSTTTSITRSADGEGHAGCHPVRGAGAANS